MKRIDSIIEKVMDKIRTAMNKEGISMNKERVTSNIVMISAICSIDAIEGDRMIDEVVGLLEESRMSPHTYMIKIDLLHVRHGLAFGPNSKKELELDGYCEIESFCRELLENIEEDEEDVYMRNKLQNNIQYALIQFSVCSEENFNTLLNEGILEIDDLYFSVNGQSLAVMVTDESRFDTYKMQCPR